MWHIAMPVEGAVHCIKSRLKSMGEYLCPVRSGIPKTPSIAADSEPVFLVIITQPFGGTEKGAIRYLVSPGV